MTRSAHVIDFDEEESERQARLAANVFNFTVGNTPVPWHIQEESSGMALHVSLSLSLSLSLSRNHPLVSCECASL